MRPSNLLSDVFRRQQEANSGLAFKRRYQFSASRVERLGFWKQLQGHTGCVNCIEWDATGRILYSGSDDLCVIVWNLSSEFPQQIIETSHTGNIFSVKPAPSTNGQVLLSGAADGKVCVNNIDRSRTVRTLEGPRNRIKQLAVSDYDPFLVWSGSEDGTVWEYDLRSNESNRVLINLDWYPFWSMENSNPVKCLAMNPVRNEQLAVGSTGPFVRLYDRRMIRTCHDWHFPQVRDYIPLVAEKVYCPGHLCTAQPRHRGSLNLCVSRIAFSGDGHSMLANIGGEQIYLFDMLGERCSARFSLPSECLTPTEEAEECAERADLSLKSDTALASESRKRPPMTPNQMDRFEMLISLANNHFSSCRYFEAIQEYNKAFGIRPRSPVVLSNRAAALLKRSWRGDVYEALRDCLEALSVDSSDQSCSPKIKAHFRMIKCLNELRWMQEARMAMDSFRSRYPTISRSRICESLHCDILASVEANPHTFTSPSVDIKWEDCIDYDKRYVGHCNTTTDIKDVTFLGDAGDFIAAGSDDGCLFIWDRHTTNILRILTADESIVNCVQANPVSDVLATSGIDTVVRLWYPNGENEKSVSDIVGSCAANQRRMSIGPIELMLFNMGFDSLSDASESALESEELRVINPRIFRCEQN